MRDTRFNHKRGFYDAPFIVLIQSRTRGARIRYTLDGTAPTSTHGLGDANPVGVRIEAYDAGGTLLYAEDIPAGGANTDPYRGIVSSAPIGRLVVQIRQAWAVLNIPKQPSP